MNPEEEYLEEEGPPDPDPTSSDQLSEELKELYE